MAILEKLLSGVIEIAPEIIDIWKILMEKCITLGSSFLN
jgi:hypothetical protein